MQRASLFDCTPDPLNQFYLNLGDGPVLVDDDENVYSLQISPTLPGGSVTASTTPPAGQRVTVESASEGRVRVLIERTAEAPGVFCLSSQNPAGAAAWFPCDEADEFRQVVSCVRFSCCADS